MPDNEEESEEVMSNEVMSNEIIEEDRCASAALLPSSGREHDERRKAQAAAARKFRLRNKFNKATRSAWKKEV